MIVVDANVIAYRFIAGEKTDYACRVQEKDRDWIVPVLWRHEFLNVLATTTRAGIITISEACTVWRAAIHALAQNEQTVDFEKALCCAVDGTISAYDAQYITLARNLNCFCITEDARLCKACPGAAISMRIFLDA
ncbi:MAG: type II toxin-antitoxin system VapC family toxin [Chitinivibrionales bacterium]|nr:type II toxin-antitoxin system VapC family toxin [Chitinivibrionales bacterium]